MNYTYKLLSRAAIIIGIQNNIERIDIANLKSYVNNQIDSICKYYNEDRKKFDQNFINNIFSKLGSYIIEDKINKIDEKQFKNNIKKLILSEIFDFIQDSIDLPDSLNDLETNNVFYIKNLKNIEENTKLITYLDKLTRKYKEKSKINLNLNSIEKNKVKLCPKNLNFKNISYIETQSNSNINLIGLPNLGNTCYINSLLQCFVSLEQLNFLIYENINNNLNNILDNFIIFFRRYKESQNNQASEFNELTKILKSLCNYIYQNNSFKSNAIGDAHELLLYLLNSFSDLEKINNSQNKISNIFNIKLYNEVKDITSNKILTSKESNENTIELVLKDKKNNIYKDLNSALNNYFSYNIDNYKLENSNNTIKVKNYTNIKNFPEILTIKLSRYNYNLQNNKIEKIWDHIDFDFNLSLSNYSATENNQKKDYKLKAIIMHYGYDNHYTSFINKNNLWYMCDDIKISGPYTDEKLKETLKIYCDKNIAVPYILFYAQGKENIINKNIKYEYKNKLKKFLEQNNSIHSSNSKYFIYKDYLLSVIKLNSRPKPFLIISNIKNRAITDQDEDIINLIKYFSYTINNS